MENNKNKGQGSKTAAGERQCQSSSPLKKNEGAKSQGQNSIGAELSRPKSVCEGSAGIHSVSSASFAHSGKPTYPACMGELKSVSSSKAATHDAQFSASSSATAQKFGSIGVKSAAKEAKTSLPGSSFYQSPYVSNKAGMEHTKDASPDAQKRELQQNYKKPDCGAIEPNIPAILPAGHDPSGQTGYRSISSPPSASPLPQGGPHSFSSPQHGHEKEKSLASHNSASFDATSADGGFSAYQAGTSSSLWPRPTKKSGFVDSGPFSSKNNTAYGNSKSDISQRGGFEGSNEDRESKKEDAQTKGRIKNGPSLGSGPRHYSESGGNKSINHATPSDISKSGGSAKAGFSGASPILPSGKSSLSVSSHPQMSQSEYYSLSNNFKAQRAASATPKASIGSQGREQPSKGKKKEKKAKSVLDYSTKYLSSDSETRTPRFD